MRGLIISAPSSGAGKTTITLGLLRAISRKGLAVRAAKSGPDYIDPRFHEAACARPCGNLDAWAMPPDRICQLAHGTDAAELLIIEGAMGLFDGAPPDGRGATADLARQLGLPVVLVVDAGRMAQSVAPLVAGFAAHDAQVPLAGVILNRVGSDRHEAMLRRALAKIDMPVFGCLRRSTELALPSRHLGLVQASEQADLMRFIDRAADHIEAAIDIDALLNAAATLPPKPPTGNGPKRGMPPAQTIAVAQDQAFAFAYPHLLDDWHAAGAVITFFSPLANEAIPPCDLVFLPGGYPELHAAKLSAADIFMQSLRNTSLTADIYGECGGYMLLGDGLIDASGTRHEMAGLLRLETSFAKPRLHLGYRRLTANTGTWAGAWAAHEFHYATTLCAQGTPLFAAKDATGGALPPAGLIHGRVSGSFMHIIN